MADKRGARARPQLVFMRNAQLQQGLRGGTRTASAQAGVANTYGARTGGQTPSQASKAHRTPPR
ncbi:MULTISPECIES: hypothetical protein [unclassified Paraburkholderia]|uniref:hypothetical protein n=1 Tax=unclassified Paraburkholderia TaxID=2615204 RepID=UPI000E264C47|nr:MULTISPECIES: hypothetical protein [unclassified Paraburkholderia]